MRSIIRVKHDRDAPYLMISKETIFDQALNWDTLGFLTFLLAQRDDWQVRPDEVAKQTGRSERTIYRMLARLITAGYVRRDTIVRRKDHGHYDSACLYTVYENKALSRDAEDRKRFTPGEIEDARSATLIDGKEVPF